MSIRKEKSKKSWPERKAGKHINAWPGLGLSTARRVSMISRDCAVMDLMHSLLPPSLFSPSFPSSLLSSVSVCLPLGQSQT